MSVDQQALARKLRQARELQSLDIEEVTAARARGRVGGQKPVLDDKQKREIRALPKDPMITVKDVAKRYGVSRTTLYKAM